MARSNHICYILGTAINEVESGVLSLIGPVLIMCMCWEYFICLYKLRAANRSQKAHQPFVTRLRIIKLSPSLGMLCWKIVKNLI